MSYVRVGYVGAGVSSVAVVRVAYVGGRRGTAAAVNVAYIGGRSNTIEANAGLDLTGLTALTRTPLVPAGVAGTFTQVSGPTVVITGAPGFQSYVTPARHQTTVLVFRLTVEGGDTDDVSHTVVRHQWWIVSGGALVGAAPHIALN